MTLNKRLFLVFIILFMIAIGLGLFTYLYSNTMASYYSSTLFLSEEGLKSYEFNVNAGDRIFITGNTTAPIYIVFSPGRQFGPFNGSFSKNFYIHISGKVYIGFEATAIAPPKINFRIIIYNSWFDSVGYPLAILFAVLALIFLAYSYVLGRAETASKLSRRVSSSRKKR